MRKTNNLGAAILALVLISNTVACSAGSRKRSAAHNMGRPEVASVASAPLAEEDASMGTKQKMGQGGQSTDAATQKRMVAYRAEVRLWTRDAKKKVKEIVELSGRYEGFMVQTSGNFVYVKIPVENLNPFLEALKQGARSSQVSLSAEDVTDSFLDTKLRLDNARKLRERFVQLLKQARDVKETLEVERELARLTEKIELMEGRIKRLKNRVSMSQVRVHIYEDTPPPPEKEYKPGPLGWVFYGLYKGGEYLWDGLYWLFVWEEEPAKK